MKSKITRIIWIIVAGALFAWCLSRYENAEAICKKIQKPLPVDSLRSKNLTEGAYVEVAFDSIYYGCYHGGIPYGKILDYQGMKLYGRDEYLFVSAYMEDDSYYQSKPYYFRSLKEVGDFEPTEKYTFLGQVRSLDEETREGLKAVVTRTRVEEPLPMTLENTDMNIEVRLVDPKKEADKKSTWMSFTIASGLIVLFMIYRLFAELHAESFLRRKERAEREANRAIEQKVRHTSKIEDDDETWNG